MARDTEATSRAAGSLVVMADKGTSPEAVPISNPPARMWHFGPIGFGSGKAQPAPKSKRWTGRHLEYRHSPSTRQTRPDHPCHRRHLPDHVAPNSRVPLRKMPSIVIETAAPAMLSTGRYHARREFFRQTSNGSCGSHIDRSEVVTPGDTGVRPCRAIEQLWPHRHRLPPSGIHRPAWRSGEV